mgnify:CR=1 FL=1
MKPIPPIPPNHPDFLASIGDEIELLPNRVCFRVATALGYKMDSSQSVPLSAIRPGSRLARQCAAVARCAWLDEAQRLVDQTTIGDVLRLHKAKLAIENNADAWAAWGRGE